MKIYLSTPYFLASDRARQIELDLCVRKNIENAAVDRIFLFIDDGHLPPFAADKIVIKPIEGRLSYKRWLDFTASLDEEHVAILANTDIYFDESVSRFDEILARRNRFVALSRVDLAGGKIAPHPNPQWSQDVWAINSRSTITTELRKAADFGLGVPRCDNKIAYEFVVHGFDVVNPFPTIRAIHVHESNVRGYHKEKDRTLIGGMAFVRPQPDLTRDSRVEVTVWPLKTASISHVRVVGALEEWDKLAGAQPEQKSAFIAHDRDWQYPAITEQWAFDRMRKFADLIPENCAYFAFPWASLIDKVDKRPASAAPLLEALERLAVAARERERVVTVCQHIRLHERQKLLSDAGITDVFWSHAVAGEDSLPDYPHIRVHPFPLYPVQLPAASTVDAPRKHLFSFVGARAKDFYLSQTRNLIIDKLGADPRGLVVARDDWHYNKIVYDHQIKKTATSGEALVDDGASEEFRAVLADSIFSLCPSGSGPNSIRLWESIGAGAIPVILADTYAPPGDVALWREAAIFCPETTTAIRALPDRLENLAANQNRLAAKRRALRQLWTLYGRDWFVPDILALFIAHASFKALGAGGGLPIGETDLVKAAYSSKSDGLWGDGEFLLNAVASRMLVDADSFADVWTRNDRLRTRCEEIASRAPDEPAASAFVAARQVFAPQGGVKKRAWRRVPRVYLAGRNVTRTPLAYDCYRAIFEKRLEYVNRPHEADVMLFGASPNIVELGDEVCDALAKKPSLKLATLSEEPLWDTTWTFDTFTRKKSVALFGRKVDYTVLNHFTTPIFDFERLPYFVTTDDRYFARYARWFARNAAMTAPALLEKWKSAKWRTAFIAEKRAGDVYDFRTPERDLYGLCAYRTRLAESFAGDRSLRAGAGWSSAERRQELADWHLDKLTMLDGNASIVSGLENTHFPTYVTEKLFDAYAALGAPLYYASQNHRIKEIVNDWSFINLFGKSTDEARKSVAEFEPDAAFADAYLAAQRRLRALFSDYKILTDERKRVAEEVVRALVALRNEAA